MSDHNKQDPAAHDAAEGSAGKRPRKKRKPTTTKPIDQWHTAREVYHDEVKRQFSGMRAIIVQIMEGRSMTAAEIRADVRVATGIDVPESTIFGQLHSLFHSGVVTDHDTEDRPCRVTRRQKKTWRLTVDALEDDVA